MALDKLEAMRAFCRIVETGNFKNAAETLNTATTTISGQIQGLEHYLGIKLLHRTTRKVSPTLDGQKYYQQILPLLKEIDEINQEIQSTDISGILRVEMPSPVADYLIVPNLRSFLAAYPNLKVEIGSSERVVDLVKDGVDCAIRGGVLADENLVAKVIGQMPFCLCATPEYLSQAPAIHTLDDLHQHHYLAFKFAATGKLGTINPVGQASFNPVFKQTFNNAQTYYLGVLAGLGVGYMPVVAAEPYFKTGQLVQILPNQAFHAMPMSFVYPQSRFIPKRIKAFLDWVEDIIATNPVWQR